jgi:DNA invertase Pin-like site-specific DNA recombinase
MNKRVVIYTRVSTTNQEDNSFLSLQLALDRQVRLVKPADVEVLRRPAPATPVAQ